MESMTAQELREYDRQNIREIDSQWDIYMTKGPESIKRIEPKEIVSIPINEIVKIDIGEDAYILVQKMTGTALKEFLKDRERFSKLYKGHSIMMVHRTKMPLFYNMNTYKIYHCKRIRAYERETSNKKCFYLGKWVENRGHFEWCIHDTRYIWADGTMDHHMYYVIITRGSNRFDGTNHFVETQELSGDELTIRQIQKDIVNILVDHASLEMKKSVNPKQDMIAITEIPFLLKIVICILIFVIFHFAKIEILSCHR